MGTDLGDGWTDDGIVPRRAAITSSKERQEIIRLVMILIGIYRVGVEEDTTAPAITVDART